MAAAGRRGAARRAAAALFALALAAAVAVALLSPYPRIENDAETYLALARNVADGKGFTVDGVAPHVYRPPLFAALLGLWFAATGSSSPLSAALFQSLVHALGVAAAFLLFVELCAPLGWAVAAGAFLAVNPVLATRVVFVLPEPTLLLGIAAATLASVALAGRPSPGRAALAGAAWGACTLAKSVCWFGPALLLATRVLPRGLGWRWRRREAAVLLLCAAAVVLPWTARNAVRFGRLIPVNAQGEGLLEWKVAHADIPGQPPGGAVLEAIVRDNPPGPARTSALWRHLAAHPRYFLLDQVVESALHYAALPRDWWIHVGGRRPHVRDAEYWLLFGVLFAPFYLALLARTALLARGRTPPPLTFPLLLLWATWAQYAVLWGDPRYNVPLYPLLVAMALPLARAGAAGSPWASPRGEHEHLGQAERTQAR